MSDRLSLIVTDCHMIGGMPEVLREDRMDQTEDSQIHMQEYDLGK